MSHMQAQIEHGEWYEVSSNHGETTWVPADVVGLEFGHVEAGKIDGATLVEKLKPFVEGTIDEDDGAAVVQAKRGYGARTSAPGYLDCTDWCVFDTEQQAIDYLAENYDAQVCGLCRDLMSADLDVEDAPEFCESCQENRAAWTHSTYGEPVRVARFRPYTGDQGEGTLILWDGNARDEAGRYCVQFRLLWSTMPEPLFDVDAGPFHGHVSVDGDKAIVGVMGFLCLKPGDTDPDYFDKYTPAQLEWAETHAESVSCEVMARYGED
jgi:hypothetical protein